MVSIRKGAAFAAIGLLACVSAAAHAESTASTEGEASKPLRIVTLGSAATETVVALGHGKQIVGIDSTSKGIVGGPAVKELGFYKKITAVGLLSVRPTLVIAIHDAGFPATFKQVERTNVRVVRLPRVASAEDGILQMQLIADAVGRSDDGQRMVAGIRRSLAALTARQNSRSSKARVLFIYARGAGAMLVGGRGTTAHAMIELVGGTNVAAAFQGYKPFSPEALVAEKPEILLMTTHGFDALGGMSGLKSHPVLSRTPAVMNGKVIARPARELLSFGPSFAQRAEALSEMIAVNKKAKE